jgi:Predicted flavin-nucleotide-binding protein
MIGQLNELQVEALLHKEIVGRIGCHTKDMVYVVPISYVYDGECIYGHTYDGLKTQTMRKNPQVCFEVDDLHDMGNWQSVIAWGVYIEIIQEEERNYALRLLLKRPLPFVSSATTHLGQSWPFIYEDIDVIDGIVFKIMLTKKTGKFESNSKSPLMNG